MRAGGGVDGLEILGDPGVGIVTVHRREPLGQFGALGGQIVLGAAAQNHDVDGVAVRLGVVQGKYRYRRIRQAQRGRVAAREDPGQAHVGAAGQGGQGAASQIAVAGDADADRV